MSNSAWVWVVPVGVVHFLAGVSKAVGPTGEWVGLGWERLLGVGQVVLVLGFIKYRALWATRAAAMFLLVVFLVMDFFAMAKAKASCGCFGRFQISPLLSIAVLFLCALPFLICEIPVTLEKGRRLYRGLEYAAVILMGSALVSSLVLPKRVNGGDWQGAVIQAAELGNSTELQRVFVVDSTCSSCRAFTARLPIDFAMGVPTTLLVRGDAHQMPVPSIPRLRIKALSGDIAVPCLPLRLSVVNRQVSSASCE